MVDLATAYMKRTRWEARIMAVEIAQLFNGTGSASSPSANRPAPTGKVVSGDDLLAMMGATIKGA
jgi:hypothetical protein